MAADFTLRPYRAEDEDAAIELWRLTWQQAYPSIDFTARVAWWRERWRNELVANAAIIVAEQAEALDRFRDHRRIRLSRPARGQPRSLGLETRHALVDEAKRLSPDGVTLLVNKDNARAIRFYERNGFVHAGEDVNPTSGRPVLKMAGERDVSHGLDGPEPLASSAIASPTAETIT